MGSVPNMSSEAVNSSARKKGFFGWLLGGENSKLASTEKEHSRWATQHRSHRLVRSTSRTHIDTSSTPQATRVYPWQKRRDGSLDHRLMQSRKYELLQQDLAQSPDLLTEWYVLIEQLDKMLQQELLEQKKGTYRRRSNTMPARTSFDGTNVLPSRKEWSYKIGTMDDSLQSQSYVHTNIRNHTNRDQKDDTENLKRLPSSEMGDPLEDLRNKLRQKESEINRMKEKLGTDDQDEKKPSLVLPRFPTRSVTICRNEDDSFGIKVQADNTKSFAPNRISGIRDQHPGIKVGDVIVEVDGVYLLESEGRKVISAIRKAGDVMTLVVADGATLDSLNESELKRAANVEKDAMKPPLSATKQEPAGSYLPNDVPGRFSQSHGPSYPRKRPRRTNQTKRRSKGEGLLDDLTTLSRCVMDKIDRVLTKRPTILDREMSEDLKAWDLNVSDLNSELRRFRDALRLLDDTEID
eukprot:m.123574 g.123574  ORF g.123574 m.123574 type:complete len:465 (+) comp14450_c0_seq14:219-1613(+)